MKQQYHLKPQNMNLNLIPSGTNGTSLSVFPTPNHSCSNLSKHKRHTCRSNVEDYMNLLCSMNLTKEQFMTITRSITYDCSKVPLLILITRPKYKRFTKQWLISGDFNITVLKGIRFAKKILLRLIMQQ